MSKKTLIKQLAEELALKHYELPFELRSRSGHEAFVAGFLAGYHSRDAEIEDLEERLQEIRYEAMGDDL